MKTISETLAEIQSEFALFTDPRDKYVLLVDYGKEAPGLDPAERNQKNRIRGCTSQAWLTCEEQPDGTLVFHTDSDAMIVKGLLSLLEKLFNGRTRQELREFLNENLLDKLGLGGTISSQRTNGFMSALEKIKKDYLS
jgi:cysteine desulfuration protein SufE